MANNGNLGLKIRKLADLAWIIGKTETPGAFGKSIYKDVSTELHKLARIVEDEEKNIK